MVEDSVHARPLAGALVLLARTTSDTAIASSATTDAQGRFTFPELPPGPYVVGIESAFLDSLEIAVPTQALTLAPGERRRLRFAIPSATTLRALACPDITLPPGTGAVIGQVSDALESRPLGGAAVAIGWSETTVDRATLRTTEAPRTIELTTDSLGRFRVCGVPTETYLELHAALASYREVQVQLAVADSEGVRRQNVALAREAPKADSNAVSATGTNEPPQPGARHGTGSLRGAVYSDTVPLRQVQVQRLGDSTAVAATTTDSLGQYQLGAVPIGTQVVDVRRLGYLPRQLTLQIRPGENRAPDLNLTSVAALDTVRVFSHRNQYPEFEQRARNSSFGRFLRADDIARKHPLIASDLIRGLPGFRIVRPNTSDDDVAIVSSRGELASFNKPGPCIAEIVIDGIPHQTINAVHPRTIGAMEIYSGPTAPFPHRSACGTIIIWTKRI